ncbi:MAG: hypothetical protein RI957_1532 [Verrucomicrobiota bacterium]|jgi:copper homeostasis protein
MKPLVEICVDRLDSVQACVAAEVDRIELCAALSEGGLTPSLGFLKAARGIFSGKIMMMIRPRAGDFLYSDEEIEVMIDDIRSARCHGADGVVFGCLHATGEIDTTNTAKLLDASGSMDVTFHRAFDVTPDLHHSLETLIRLGIPRVLTSGGEADVWKGLPSLRELIKQAGTRMVIMPGGGIMASRVEELLEQTDASEFHLSARHSMPSRMIFQRDDIRMGSSQITPESFHKITDPAQLRLLFTSLASRL